MLGHIGKLVLFMILALTAGTSAHENHHAPEAPTQSANNEALVQINMAYKAIVEPIFRRSCYDCHSSSTNYPWYASLPIIKTMIDDDIGEARKHLDMSDGFPFKGHGGSPAEDLEAIRQSIEAGSMPPFKYLALHWKARMSTTDKEKVLKWLRESQASFK